jgi:hypothetical protein
MNIPIQKRTAARSSLDCPIVAAAHFHRVWRASSWAVACWLFLNPTLGVQSRNQESQEYPVKLAFLYNFTKFVEWPPSSYGEAGSPLTICIVGDDPFSPNLRESCKPER